MARHGDSGYYQLQSYLQFISVPSQNFWHIICDTNKIHKREWDSALNMFICRQFIWLRMQEDVFLPLEPGLFLLIEVKLVQYTVSYTPLHNNIIM